jgi:hypothetical protein
MAGALACLVLAGLTWKAGCSRTSSSSPSVPTSKPQSGKHDVLPSDGNLGVPDDQEENNSEHLSRHPELAFTERSEGLPTSGTWIGYPLLFDFNGDGRADLIASNREEDGFSAWMAPSGKGPWVRCIQGLPRDMGYGPARAADVNSDGKPDLLLSAHSDALRVYLNDGEMHWTQSPAKIENPYLMLDIAVGNLNGDKFPDIVGLAHFKGGFGVYLGDGAGGFRRLPESSSIVDAANQNTPLFGHDVELADIDGDGLDDIVAATNHGARVFLTRNGDPMHWEDISAGLPAPKIGNSLYSVVPGHFTNQKSMEIALCMVGDPSQTGDQRNTIGVYSYDAQQKRWKQIDKGLARDENYRDLRAADFNGDGNLDLIAMSLESGGLIYLGDGKGGFTAKGRLPGIHGKGRIALGDIDGDGRTDVVIAVPAEKPHPESGGVRAFLNRAEIWK